MLGKYWTTELIATRSYAASSMPVKSSAPRCSRGVTQVNIRIFQRLRPLRSSPGTRVYREPFVLVVALGKSYAEAAAILGLREATVRQRVSRARRTMRGELGGLLGEVLGSGRGKVAAAVAVAIASSLLR